MTIPKTGSAPLALLLAAGLAATASAKIPDVLNHVPGDTALYIVVPNVSTLIGDLSAFNQAMADKLPPDAAGAGMALFFAQSLANQPGFNAEGSAAVLVDLEAQGVADLEGAEPEVTILLPIDDLETYAEGPFLAGQGASFDADGVLTAAMPEGDTIYMRDIGTHTVAGPDAGAVKAFNAGEWLDTHKGALRTAGALAVETGDLSIVANLPKFDGLMESGIRQMEQQVGFLAMMGGGEAVTQSFAAVKQAADTLRRDGSVGLICVDVAGDGISIDLGAAFRDGTESAEFFTAKADTAPLMGVLPQTDYLAAFAFDASSEKLHTLVQSALALSSMGGEGGLDMNAMLKNSDGFSGVIGSSPAAFGGAGLLARQVTFARSDNPTAAVKAMHELVSGLNGQSQMGMNYTTEYNEGGAEVDGAAVDTFSVRTAVDPSSMGGGMMMDPAMIQSMMYGMSGGPSGFVAKVDKGFYTTMSRNSELLSSAIAASKGGSNLFADQNLTAVASRLHEHRFAEAYLSADQMFNAFGPFAQMLGMIDAFEPLPAMRPVGLSARGDHGGVLVRLFLPGDVIGFIAEFAQSMEADDMPGGGDGDPMEPDF